MKMPNAIWRLKFKNLKKKVNKICMYECLKYLQTNSPQFKIQENAFYHKLPPSALFPIKKPHEMQQIRLNFSSVITRQCDVFNYIEHNRRSHSFVTLLLC